MIAIGIGANSKAQADDFVAVLASICKEISGDVVATFEYAPFIDVLKSAASRRSILYCELTLAELQRRNDDCRTRSQRTLDLFGVMSVAEASALAAAGPRSQLLVPRRIIGNITVAAAKSADAEESPQ
jgi:cobalt-precorrin 5A hydrolase